MNPKFKFPAALARCGIALAFALALNTLPAAEPPSATGPVAEAPGLAEQAREKLKDATAAAEDAANNARVSVQDTTRAVGNSFENLRRGVEESRLKNRTPDEIVAWVIMGVLVGSVAGMLTSLKPTGLGHLGRLLLGLGGAFIGGVVAHVTRIDFGWGPVLIRYEDLLFSFAGAILLIVLARLIRRSAKKKPGE